jgi:hypothetical protein
MNTATLVLFTIEECIVCKNFIEVWNELKSMAQIEFLEIELTNNVMNTYDVFIAPEIRYYRNGLLDKHDYILYENELELQPLIDFISNE